MNKSIKFLLLIPLTTAILLQSPSVHASATTCTSSWRCYTQGVEFENKKNYLGAIPYFKDAIAKDSTNASYYSHLASDYKLTNQNQLASETYSQHAKILRNKGLVQEAITSERLAESLKSEVNVYVSQEPKIDYTLQKFEPTSGMYIGAYINGETTYKTSDYYFNKNEYTDFNQRMNKKHALFFDYGSYGNSLFESFGNQPEDLKASGSAFHIAYQPGNLANMDMDVIKDYAIELHNLDIPIFLRYASEMNGDWVPWHGNPTLYKENWKKVHDIMAQYAPNVAMVWSPSEMPIEGVEQYYPGNDYVDWIGVSIYNAQFSDGDITKPTDNKSPLEAVDYLYKRFAKDKPIMISEYAASHQAGFTNNKQDTSAFAKMKMTNFYETLKIKYPRVKSLHWFSQNNYLLEDSSKNRVNYSLLEANKSIQDTYKKIISDPYFLSNVVNGPSAAVESNIPKTYVPLTNQTVKNGEEIVIQSKLYDPYINKMTIKYKNNIIGESTNGFLTLNNINTKLEKGIQNLQVVVYDSKNIVGLNTNKSIYQTPYQDNYVSLTIGKKDILANTHYDTLSTAPFFKNERTMVPLRFISEQLGQNVQYDSTTKEITLVGSKTIRLVSNNNKVKVNSSVVTIDVPPIELNGTTFVPVRFVSEQLGFNVDYNSNTRTLIIK